MLFFDVKLEKKKKKNPYFIGRRKRDQCDRRQTGNHRAGQPTASGTTSRAVPRNDARVASAQELVSGGVRVDGPGQIVLAEVDQNGPVRSVRDDELQLAARHVVRAFVRQSPQHIAMALLVSWP